MSRLDSPAVVCASRRYKSFFIGDILSPYDDVTRSEFRDIQSLAERVTFESHEFESREADWPRDNQRTDEIGNSFLLRLHNDTGR